jgi:DNA-binding MarR family transcriptional regulator
MAANGGSTADRSGNPRRLQRRALRSPSGQQYQYDVQVGHLLRRALQRNLSIFSKHFETSELTSVQFIVLCAVAEHAPISQNLVGRLVALDPSTTKGVVERLAERGLVSIRPDAGDRRKLVIELSRSGKTLLRGLIDKGLRVTEATFGALNPAERVALVYLLRKMVEAGG